MPRGRKTQVYSQQPNIAETVLKSMFEVKRLESAKLESMKSIFTEKSDSTDLGDNLYRSIDGEEKFSPQLKDLYVDVVSTFRLDHSYKVRATLVFPREVDKKRTHKLPVYPDKGFIYRVVVVGGSHEIFYSDAISKISKATGSAGGIFVPQGSATIISKGLGDFTFDNKGNYDSNIYPGKGMKRPENRLMVVFDFITFNDAHFDDAKKSAIEKATQAISSEGNGIFSSLLKTFGVA